MKGSRYGRLFLLCRRLVHFVFPKYDVQFPKDLHDGVVYISSHQNLFGPFMMLHSFPKEIRTWILHVFLEQKLCFQQYRDYTFTKRFRMPKMLATLLAYPISFFIPKLLKSGKGIPVYRGSKKIVKTLKESVDALKANENIALFPDKDYTDTSANVSDLYEGFLYLEKYYYKETGKHVEFVPVYISKKRKLIVADEPIRFRDGKNFMKERNIVLEKIQNRLNELAKEWQ